MEALYGSIAHHLVYDDPNFFCRVVGGGGVLSDAKDMARGSSLPLFVAAVCRRSFAFCRLVAVEHASPTAIRISVFGQPASGSEYG